MSRPPPFDLSDKRNDGDTAAGEFTFVDPFVSELPSPRVSKNLSDSSNGGQTTPPSPPPAPPQLTPSIKKIFSEESPASVGFEKTRVLPAPIEMKIGSNVETGECPKSAVGFEENRVLPAPSDITSIGIGANKNNSIPVFEKPLKRKRTKKRCNKRSSFVSMISSVDSSKSTESDEYIAPEPNFGKKRKFSVNVDSFLSPSSALSENENPSDWHLGNATLCLKEDEDYLNSMHCLIRKHLEIFTATEKDANESTPGRRAPVVIGKVGIRCIACRIAATKSHPEGAQHPQLQTKSGRTDKRKRGAFSGSVSFPNSISLLYPLCSQKPSLHFIQCGNLDPVVRDQFISLLYDPEGNPIRQRSKQPNMNGITPVQYYTIAGKRQGLVDVKGGMRLTRDPTLPPLPMANFMDSISSSVSIVPDISFRPDLPPNQEFIHDSERPLVTKFVFLNVKQMRLCHSSIHDLKKGKRVINIPVGFSGFCCKWCNDRPVSANHNSQGSSGRFFSKAPNYLVSSVNSAFYQHLLRCVMAPEDIKKDLSVAQNSHSRDMSSLRRGAQTKFFLIMWSRLRRSDNNHENYHYENNDNHNDDENDKDKDNDIDYNDDDNNNETATKKYQSSNRPPSQTSSPEVFPADPSNQISNHLARTEVEGITKEVLQSAVSDSLTDDTFICPSDRPHITDYVFLTLHQMAICNARLRDITRGVRSANLRMGLAGFCCKHCNKDNAALTGRSFPTKTDYISSATNCAFYNHLLKCFMVPPEIKDALTALKKCHHAQIGSLKSGSQRRFFRVVWDKIRDADMSVTQMRDKYPSDSMPEFMIKKENIDNEPVTHSIKLKNEPDAKVLRRHCFVETPIHGGWFSCVKCRMVPLDFRGEGSLSQGCPSEASMGQHRLLCKGGQLDLTTVVSICSRMIISVAGMTVDTLIHPLFKNVVSSLVGGNDKLSRVFTEGIKVLMDDGEAMDTKDLWKDFPHEVDLESVHSAINLFSKGEDTGVSGNLKDNQDFSDFIYVIAPYLDLARWWSENTNGGVSNLPP